MTGKGLLIRLIPRSRLFLYIVRLTHAWWVGRLPNRNRGRLPTFVSQLRLDRKGIEETVCPLECILASRKGRRQG